MKTTRRAAPREGGRRGAARTASSAAAPRAVVARGRGAPAAGERRAGGEPRLGPERSPDVPRSACVLGLGKLGAPLAAALAARGLEVVGVDVDATRLAALRAGRAPVFEPGLEEAIRLGGARLRASDDVEAAVRATDATFIVVATPSEPAGGFSLRYVLPACEAVGRALATDRRDHLVILTSTVMPGATGGPVREALERASGLRCGDGFGLCYGPEFIALGSVIRDFLHPDLVLIGESDRRAGDRLQGLYERVCENRPAVARMSWVDAEITKLAINTFLTTKISFANTLARIAEGIPGADVDVITAAVGLDTRIGAKYLKGALSYGGPCFPRDNVALAALARSVGAPAALPQAVDGFNRGQIAWLAERVEGALGPGGVAGILGLTYKPGTDVVEEAAGLLLAAELSRRGRRVVAWDPSGAAGARARLDGAVSLAADAATCIAQSDVVVLATAWKDVTALPPAAWGRPGTPRVVIDCWRALRALAGVEGVRYQGLGLGEDRP